MDKFDLDVEEKDIIGGFDRLLVNVGMALIALFPTYFYLIFRPKLLCPMLLGKEVDGREGLKLGPGVTFILTLFLLLAFGYILKDVMASDVTAEAGQEKEGGGLRAAIAEGNIWRSVILSLPFYLAALVVGVLFDVSHRIFKKKSNLTQAVSVGLYSISTLLLSIAAIGMTGETYANENETVSLIIVNIIFLSFMFIILPWQFYSFSRHAFGNSKRGAAAIALTTCFLTMLSFFAVVFVSMSLSSQDEISSQAESQSQTQTEPESP